MGLTQITNCLLFLYAISILIHVTYHVFVANKRFHNDHCTPRIRFAIIHLRLVDWFLCCWRFFFLFNIIFVLSIFRIVNAIFMVNFTKCISIRWVESIGIYKWKIKNSWYSRRLKLILSSCQHMRADYRLELDWAVYNILFVIRAFLKWNSFFMHFIKNLTFT